MKKVWIAYGRKFSPVEVWDADKYDALDRIIEENYMDEDEAEDFSVEDVEYDEHNGASYWEVRGQNGDKYYTKVKPNDFSYGGTIDNQIASDIALFTSKKEAIAYVVKKNPYGQVNENGTMYASIDNGMWEYIVKEKEVQGVD